ncbi:MAG TPA: hypothetical protein ENI05_15545 [Porticoccus sp.]|nr:hypothetical protein [Porticoccus sp.]
MKPSWIRVSAWIRILATLIGLVLWVGASQANSAEYEEVIYYHNDALGSPIVATDQNGDVLWREEYTPYGSRLTYESRETNCTILGCAPIESPWDEKIWYTGKIEETRLGLNYFGARWYDPELGRFISQDPVGFKASNIQSFNRYAYANNNPYRYIDPDGREIKSVLNGSSTTINFTGVVIDRTGTLSKPQLTNLASRMKGQIESSFTGRSGSGRWSTNATIDVGVPGDKLSGRHEINIQPSSSFRNSRVLGNVDEIGGSQININENLKSLSPKNSATNASFERTSAHEFGHSAGLLHSSGGLMQQTRSSNSLNISKSQIDTMHKNNK